VPPTPRGRLVIARRKDDALIGKVGFYWSMKQTHWPAAGMCIFDPEQWGRGLCFEALGMWIDYLVTAEPRFHRMDLRTRSGNIGMCRLAEKLGFREEARCREAVVVGGERYDSIGYGMLRAEWAVLYPGGFHVQAGG